MLGAPDSRNPTPRSTHGEMLASGTYFFGTYLSHIVFPPWLMDRKIAADAIQSSYWSILLQRLELGLQAAFTREAQFSLPVL